MSWMPVPPGSLDACAGTNARPLRLGPGADLRGALEALVRDGGTPPAFVVCGIGSLHDPRLRFAGASQETVLRGPFEVLSLAGSLTMEGAHLHATVADAQGRVLGGHLCHGSVVRTTMELLLAFTPQWALTREPDADTGHAELVVRPAGRPPTPQA